MGDEDNVRTANTTNRMLTNMVYSDGMSYYYAYATGIKTGSHDQAGYCIVASATYGGYTYIVACLGSPRWTPTFTGRCWTRPPCSAGP